MQRPDKFRIDIASGVLVSLGVNMYTSVGKSLAEFVANAYDAEASKVEIAIPFEQIADVRAATRTAAKAAVEKGDRPKFSALADALPDDIEITIRDDGHGMSPDDIEKRFLIVNRNRREQGPKSETGQRYVMGRKGLGKLAGFGTAEKITIYTKRAGESFATEFTMDYRKIEQQEKLHESFFEAQYHENLDVAAHGTTITLSALRCDSLKASEGTVYDILAQNFSLHSDSFDVLLNGAKIRERPAEYEFVYPEGQEGVKDVEVDGVAEFPISYRVRFRARESDSTPAVMDENGQKLQRGSLPTGLRGARIYCNGRLAAGPSMFYLHTGMHNFHSQAYMECIVNADQLDRQAIDHIGTNRAELKGDSDIVEALKSTVTEIMRLALYEHSKFRDKAIEGQVAEDPFTQGLLARIAGVSPAIRKSTNRLLTTLASAEGVASPLYKAAAPLVLESMNAGEVLARLINLEADPQSLVLVAHELLELARVENRDVIKLYRGRRNGIEAVRKLIDQARATWKKGAKFEAKLHTTLKENPWLIRPEFSRYLTSDKPLGDVAKELSQLLKIDEHAPPQELDGEGNIADEDKRPDLVFCMVNPSMRTIVDVVELKTPNYPLRIQHLNQLKGYMMQIEEWLKQKYPGPVVVRGYLIGDTDATSTAHDVKLLNHERSQAGLHSNWEIIPLPELLERAKQTHLDVIEVSERYEEFYDQELSTDRHPIALPAPEKAGTDSDATAANDPTVSNTVKKDG